METIGLLAAVRRESAAIARAHGLASRHGVSIGIVGGRRLVAMVAGMGAGRIETAFDDMMRTWGPASLIHVGFAGGLDPGLDAGAVPNVAEVRSTAGGPALHLPPQGPPVPAAESRTGPALLSTDRLVTTADEKRRLHAATGAQTVDLESYPLARCAAAAGVELRIFRAVLDTASMDLDPCFGHWIDAVGRTRWARLVRDVVGRPSLLPAAARLGRHARIAESALQAAVAARLAAPGSKQG